MTRPPFQHLPSPACAQAPPFLLLNRRIDAVLATLRAADRPWILGASGGIDSSAAMLLLARAKVPCLVVHVQHHLRADAHRDQQVVQVQAAQLGLPHYVVHLTPPKRGETENISARSRRLRYDALSAIAEQLGAQLFTAHHTEDLLETFLLRVQRGTGIAQAFGLQETMHWKGQAIHRPLLALWKSELRQLVEDARFPWIEDSSNSSDAYARNALRQALAPLIEHLGAEPRFGETLVALTREAAKLRGEAKELASLASLFSAPIFAPADSTALPSALNASRAGGWLDRAELLKRFSSVDELQQSLYQWCRAEGFSVRRELLSDVSGWVWAGRSGQRDATGLHFESSPLGLRITPHDGRDDERTQASSPEFVPLSENEWTSVGALRLRIEPAALESAAESNVIFARPLQPGDRFASPSSGRPVGVRKRLTRDGVPAIERAQAVVLAIHTESGQKDFEHDAYRILGVIYAPEQRVELRREHGERFVAVSSGAKPSND